MTIDFKKGNSLVPVIIQDVNSKTVLMLGYMDQSAYEKTVRDGRVTFYSRSKQRLWTKGEVSGNFLNVEEILPDCDNDTLLIKVIPEGPVCHTGSDTCFAEKNLSDKPFLRELENIIADRKVNPKENSYTNQLFNTGIKKIAQKVGEEATELVIEAIDDNTERFKSEAADLLYHYLVLLAQMNLQLADIESVLRERHKK